MAEDRTWSSASAFSSGIGTLSPDSYTSSGAASVVTMAFCATSLSPPGAPSPAGDSLPRRAKIFAVPKRFTSFTLPPVPSVPYSIPMDRISVQPSSGGISSIARDSVVASMPSSDGYHSVEVHTGLNPGSNHLAGRYSLDGMSNRMSGATPSVTVTRNSAWSFCGK